MLCGYLGAPLDCWKTASLPKIQKWEEIGANA